MGITNNMMFIVGILYLSMTMMPSLAQDVTSSTPAMPELPECLQGIQDCVAKQKDPNDPFAVPDFSKCCPELETGVANPKYFCRIEGIYKDFTLPNITAFNGTVVQPTKPPFSQVELEYNRIFDNCSIHTTFAKLCDDVTGDSKSARASSSASVIGLISGSIFLVWTVIMS